MSTNSLTFCLGSPCISEFHVIPDFSRSSEFSCSFTRWRLDIEPRDLVSCPETMTRQSEDALRPIKLAHGSIVHRFLARYRLVLGREFHGTTGLRNSAAPFSFFPHLYQRRAPARLLARCSLSLVSERNREKRFASTCTRPSNAVVAAGRCNLQAISLLPPRLTKKLTLDTL